MTKKFNLRNFWREITIGLMAAMLLWTSLTDGDTIHKGATYTDCVVIRDTVTQIVPHRVVEYRRVQVDGPVYIDTSYHMADTLTDDSSDYAYVPDTLYDVIDLPVTEYIDSASYYVRTLGWLDSISVHNKTVKVIDTQYKPRTFSLYITNHLGRDTYAPGISATWRRIHAGYNVNVVDGAGTLTLGYRLY